MRVNVCMCAGMLVFKLMHSSLITSSLISFTKSGFTLTPQVQVLYKESWSKLRYGFWQSTLRASQRTTTLSSRWRSYLSLKMGVRQFLSVSFRIEQVISLFVFIFKHKTARNWVTHTKEEVNTVLFHCNLSFCFRGASGGRVSQCRPIHEVSRE